jgi:hypothetical protein
VPLKNLKIRIYMTVTLFLIVYGCEALSVTLREEPNLRTGVQMIIFGLNRDEVIGWWRR